MPDDDHVDTTKSTHESNKTNTFTKTTSHSKINENTWTFINKFSSIDELEDNIRDNYQQTIRKKNNKKPCNLCKHANYDKHIMRIIYKHCKCNNKNCIFKLKIKTCCYKEAKSTSLNSSLSSDDSLSDGLNHLLFSMSKHRGRTTTNQLSRKIGLSIKFQKEIKKQLIGDKYLTAKQIMRKILFKGGVYESSRYI